VFVAFICTPDASVTVRGLCIALCIENAIVIVPVGASWVGDAHI
jgi:hypothetical protein